MYIHSGPNVYSVGSVIPSVSAYVYADMDYDWDRVSYVNREWDFVYSLLVGCVLAGLPAHVTGDSTRVECLHSYPLKVPYSHAADHANYASPWSDFLTLRKVLFDQGRGARGARNENQIVHGSSIGDAYGGFISFHAGDPTLMYMGRSVPCPSYNGYPESVGPDGLPTGASNTLVGGVRPAFTRALNILKEHFNPNVVTWDWNGYIQSHKGVRYGHVDVRSFDYEITDDGFKVEYTQRVRRDHGLPPNGNWDEVSISTTLLLRRSLTLFREETVISPISGYFNIGSLRIDDLFFDHERYNIQDPNDPGSTSAFGQHIRSMNVTQDLYGIPFGRSTSYVTGDSVSKLVKVLQTEDQRLRSLFDQYVGHAYVTAGLAVHGFDELVKSICLESLSELSELVSLFPDASPLIDFTERVVGKKNFLSAGVKLVDFAANTYLLAKFGLIPFKDLIFNFASEYDVIRARLSTKMSGQHNLYGKDTIYIDKGPLKNYKLTTRTKLVVGFPEECVGLALMPLRNANLTRMQDIWNVVPFSFVIDWFIKASDRMTSVDSALFAFTGVVNFATHSYTLQSPLGDQLEYDNVDFSHVDYEFYLRAVSKYYPGAKSSYIDFWSGNGPPILIGGALLWSLLRR